MKDYDTNHRIKPQMLNLGDSAPIVLLITNEEDGECINGAKRDHEYFK